MARGCSSSSSSNARRCSQLHVVIPARRGADKELARARHFLQLVRLPGKQFEGDGLAVHRACELPHGPDPDGKCIKTDFYFTDVDPDILHVFFAAVIAYGRRPPSLHVGLVFLA